jgi:hypothetical protein
MIEFHKIWIDQCEAARDIRDAFGPEKAIGYLIGEKFLNYLEASDEDAAFAVKLPRFIEEIRQIFEPTEIRAYLDGVRRVGALGPCAPMTCTKRCETPARCQRIRSRGRSRFCAWNKRGGCSCPDGPTA